MTESAFDEEDWQDLEKARPLRSASMKDSPDVTVRLVKRCKKLGVPERASTLIFFRREPGEWVSVNGPRFKVQIGGSNANALRFIPDQAGRFKCTPFKGLFRIHMGFIAVWPDEEREATEAKYTITAAGLVLTLPAGFARPLGTKAAPSMPVAAKAPPVKLAAAPAGRDERKEREEDEYLLRAALGVTSSFPREFGSLHFTAGGAAILETLLAREQITKEGLLIATHDPSKGDDERPPKIIDVMLCKLRKKLNEIGIEIENIWGGSVKMPGASKASLRRFIEHAKKVAS